MKIYNGTQHEDTGDANESWLALRAGKFTGSDFHQYMGIVKKSMLSESAESNLYQKVLESLGQTFDSYTSDAMARGTELESFARKEYAKVDAVLRRNHFEQLLGADNICNHIDLALARARQLVGHDTTAQ